MTGKSIKALTYIAMGLIGAFIGYLIVAIKEASLENRGIPSDGFGGHDWGLVIVMAIVFLMLAPLIHYKFIANIQVKALEKIGVSFYSGTLSIEKRGSYLKGLLSVRRAKYLNYKYNDPKLVYTGATVGGISMGGFHVEKGGYSSEVLKSDTYQLVYNNPKTDEKTPIECIYLPHDCIYAAQKDARINKLLCGGFINLTGGYAGDKAATDTILSQGLNEANFGKVQQSFLAKYQLSQGDLLYVKRWLCKNI